MRPSTDRKLVEPPFVNCNCGRMRARSPLKKRRTSRMRSWMRHQTTRRGGIGGRLDQLEVLQVSRSANPADRINNFNLRSVDIPWIVVVMNQVLMLNLRMSWMIAIIITSQDQHHPNGGLYMFLLIQKPRFGWCWKMDLSQNQTNPVPLIINTAPPPP